ncbi:MAG: hypothetical protein ACR2PV_02380 [Gammaproteobacteria bacterium]
MNKTSTASAWWVLLYAPKTTRGKNAFSLLMSLLYAIRQRLRWKWREWLSQEPTITNKPYQAWPPKN